MSKRMRKNVQFLTELKKAAPSVRKRMLKHATRPQITTLAEISKNVLANKIKLKPGQKRRLCKYKKIIRSLASRNTNFKSKKKQVQQKGGFAVTSLLLSAAIPLITHLLTRNKK